MERPSYEDLQREYEQYTIKLWDARDVVRKLELGRAAVANMMKDMVQEEEIYHGRS